MTDLLLLPVVMLASLEPSDPYVTPIAPYPRAIDCFEDMARVQGIYMADRPNAVFWCAAPIGGFVLPDPTAIPDATEESSLAPRTSPRPRPRPDMESKID